MGPARAHVRISSSVYTNVYIIYVYINMYDVCVPVKVQVRKIESIESNRCHDFRKIEPNKSGTTLLC